MRCTVLQPSLILPLVTPWSSPSRSARVLRHLLAWWWLRGNPTPRMMFMVCWALRGVACWWQAQWRHCLILIALSGYRCEPRGACAFRVHPGSMSRHRTCDSSMVFYFAFFLHPSSSSPLYGPAGAEPTQAACEEHRSYFRARQPMIMSQAVPWRTWQTGPLSYLALCFPACLHWFLWDEVPDNFPSWLSRPSDFAST